MVDVRAGEGYGRYLVAHNVTDAGLRVAFAGSGLSIASPQLAGVENNIEDDLDFGLSIARDNKRIAKAKAGVTSASLSLKGANAAAGFASRASASRTAVVGTGTRGLLSILNRG